MQMLRSMAGFLAALLVVLLLAAAAWFWMEKDARAERPDGILVFEKGTAAEALAAPADILLPVSGRDGEGHL